VTQAEYLNKLMETYRLVGVLADKNGCRTLRVRHREQERDLVVRHLPRKNPAYETLCAIRCENLPLIYDVISLEDGQIVLEEYVEGLTVAEVMESGRYRYRGAKQVLQGVCHALAVLHERGLVHRDVKPENIIIDPNGRVVLIDFNAARRCSVAKRDTVIMGTVGYASPEQLGLAQSDARTDIYAAGVLLNVMVCGKHPGEQFAPGRAGRIARKCTHVNPADRYQSAKKLAEAL